MARKLRVGFMCAHDPYDRTAFSGTPSYMLDALSRLPDVDLEVMGPWRPGFAGRVLRKLRRKLGLRVQPPTAAQVRGLDWVITPVSSHLVAGRSAGRFVHITDATPQFLREFYNSSIGPKADADEARAIDQAALVVYSSEFMAARAVTEFGARYSSRIHAISFGLNLATLPPVPASKPPAAPLRLLFVGLDWQRKGGETALAAVTELNRRGIHARLTVIGSNPEGLSGHADVEVIPFLNKQNPEDYARLTKAFADAHFFLLPTRADCTPMVVAEANAYGTPVLISAIGGIPSLVSTGDNGVLMPPDAVGADYADQISALIADRAAYDALCARSYAWCRDHLTWDAWARSLVSLLRDDSASGHV